MSIKSQKIVIWEPVGMVEVPSDEVLKFNYRSFRTGRVFFAKKQIDRLVSKIILHPEKKSYFIQEINKLILYELGENKFE